MHPLDGHDEIHGAQHGPGARPKFVHPGEALEPLAATHGRPVAAELRRLDLEAQQPQPVAQAPVGDEFRHAGHEAPAPAHALPPARTQLAQPPQAQRMQAADDHAPLGHEHALDLAQRHMRVRAALERVRQQHEVQALRGERQGCRIGEQRRPRAGQMPLGRCCHALLPQRQPTVRHAVAAQPVELRQPQLQAVVAEHIGHGGIEALLLPGQQVAAGSAVEPVKAAGI